MSPPREIELKLEVPISSLSRLGRSSLFKNGGASPQMPSSLVSVYFDTKKLKLHNNALSLRVRRIGRRYLQTIKKENGASAGLFDRNEWEHEVGARQPNLDVAGDTALAPLLSKKLRRGLKPVFATRVHRKIFQIQSGNSEVELSIDRGKIEAGQKSSPLCELELELKQGEAADLFKLAKSLADVVPVQLAVLSKAERGYALLAAGKPAAVKARPISITPEIDVKSAFQAIARACLHQLVANRPIMLDGDPEGLHQMRVSLRRLRAAISLFSDMLATPQTDALKAEFKWLTRELGPARELDIFLKSVVKPAATAKRHQPGISAVGRELRQRHEEAVARAHSAVESSRCRSLVLDAVGWIEAGDWTQNPDVVTCRLRKRQIVDVAAAELRRRWKKILKQGRHLEELEPERRHQLRIRTKKLRYAAEFFAGAFPAKKSKRRRENFVETLEKLQDSLGELNDIAVHEELSERLAQTKSGRHKRRRDSHKAFAAGRLSGREEARIAPLLKEAKQAYAVFADAKPFWA